MRIGELAAQADVNIQTVRYYERRELLRPASRSASGYRNYDANDVRRVRFIRKAQNLGFTLHEIADLLALQSDAGQSCQAVEARASVTLERIASKIGDLDRMRDGLAVYVQACRHRKSLDACPLLAALGGEDG